MLRMLKVILVQSRLHISPSLSFINGAKDKIHLFQGLPLGLLDEEGDENTHASAEATEHDECLPMD